jgi:hypothetical protein
VIAPPQVCGKAWKNQIILMHWAKAVNFNPELDDFLGQKSCCRPYGPARQFVSCYLPVIFAIIL